MLNPSSDELKQFYYTTFKSPLGEIVLTGNHQGLTGLYTLEQIDIHKVRMGILNNIYFEEAITQLQEYFEGKRRNFDLTLAPIGTVFQKLVWQALNTIPYGKTKSYKEIAELIGLPKACRAVGLANSKNPLSIIVPCHRVIGSDGKLIGYSGGVKIKKWLLNHELIAL
jgi:methylated-DNA-[protein]-cysteine S-methyltransferase